MIKQFIVEVTLYKLIYMQEAPNCKVNQFNFYPDSFLCLQSLETGAQCHTLEHASPSSFWRLNKTYAYFFYLLVTQPIRFFRSLHQVILGFSVCDVLAPVSQFHFLSIVISSLQLFFGRPLVLTPTGFQSVIVLTTFVSSVLLRCPHCFNLRDFVYGAIYLFFLYPLLQSNITSYTPSFLRVECICSYIFLNTHMPNLLPCLFQCPCGLRHGHRPFVCWNCGFESRRFIDVCVFLILCVVR
jgi:hypothetical protein